MKESLIDVIKRVLQNSPNAEGLGTIKQADILAEELHAELARNMVYLEMKDGVRHIELQVTPLPEGDDLRTHNVWPRIFLEDVNGLMEPVELTVTFDQPIA